MNESIKRYRDWLEVRPNASMYQTEFGNGYYFGLDRWAKEGMPQDIPKEKLFGFDENAQFYLQGKLGASIMVPEYESEILEENDQYVIYRDLIGRVTKNFKESSLQYMPEFIGYSVTDAQAWENDVKPRLNVNSPERYAMVDSVGKQAQQAAAEGKVVTLEVDGGFMYLRDLFGPQNLLVSFVDTPELIHDAMRHWADLHIALATAYQKYVDIELFWLDEDICYKTSSLISPSMIEEFLFPYYREVIESIQKNNKKIRKLYIGIDSDGHIESVIPLYKKIGCTLFSPCEVAADCDVVELGKKYPDISLFGGFDKRILATSKENIRKEAERIFPAMKARGGYFPTCDHGVPENVSYENYLYFREMIEKLCK